MNNKDFRVKRDGPIARITLCQPQKANALGLDFWKNFEAALTDLNDGNTRALIIDAEGKNFCAGIDTELLSGDNFVTDTAQHRLRIVELAERLQTILGSLEQLRFPTIAVVQGACIGAGLELAICCDFRICSRDAYFQIGETNVGIMADLGALQRLPHMLPYGVAVDMAMSGSRLPALRAFDLGFIYGYQDAPLNAANELADRLTNKSPLALAGIKRSILYARDHPINDGLLHCAALQGGIFDHTSVQNTLGANSGSDKVLQKNLHMPFSNFSGD